MSAAKRPASAGSARTEHVVDVASLEYERRVMGAVADVQDSYIAGRSPGEVFDTILSHVLEITDSEYGYIGEVLRDEDGQPYLKTHAMTDISWDVESRRIYEQAMQGGGFEFRNLRTLFGAVLTTGEAVIANDAPNDPRAGGKMRGHLPLDRYLGLPLYSEGEMVGSVGVSNRPGGYSEELVAALRPFLSTCGNLVRAFRDHRARRAAELAAETSRRQLQAVVDAAADGILTFGDDGRAQSWNRALVDLVGLDAVGVVHVTDLVHPDDRDRLEAATAAADGAVVDLRLRRRDGGDVLVDASFTTATLPAGRLHVAVVRDATARHETESALVAAKEQAERTNRAKDDFLAAMSHELRTPLNGVIGLSTLLAEELHGPLTDRQAEYVAAIRASGAHLLALINDILDLTKIEADRLAIDLAPVDVAAVVAAATEIVEATPQARGRRVEVDLAPGPRAVRGNERRVQQVLVNLLSNAMKFTPDDGRVGVRVSCHDEAVRLEVWDEGIGIDPALFEQLFRPFEQVDAGLAREHEGTGLGLALSRRLVELQGGTLTVASAPDAGATFTVELPAA